MIRVYLLQVLSSRVLMNFRNSTSNFANFLTDFKWKLGLETPTNNRFCHDNNDVAAVKGGIFVHPEYLTACKIWRGSKIFISHFVSKQQRRPLKKIMPTVKSVYMRRDNTGCYHSASALVLVYQVATKHGINLKRVDFSDPKGGKGSCNRKAPTIKSHMRIYLNSGHDTETASQMMTATESADGIAGVRVTVSGPKLLQRQHYLNETA